MVAELKTIDGHEIKVIKDGRVVRCTTCEEIEKKYADILEKRQDLQKELSNIKRETYPKVKVELLEQFEHNLEQIQGKQKQPERKRKPENEVISSSPKKPRISNEQFIQDKRNEDWEKAVKALEKYGIKLEAKPLNI